jgi:hypothetical protein
MIKRMLSICVVLTALGACVPATAGMDLSLYGSWFTPSDLDSSFGGGAKIDILLGDSPFAIEFRGSYFPELGRDLRDFIEGEDSRFLKVEMIPLDAGFNIHLFDNRNLYFGGGFSYVLLDSNIGRLSDEFGWYMTAGLKTGKPGGGVAFFIDGQYRVIEGTVEDGDFSSFDVGVDGFGLNTGIALRF